MCLPFQIATLLFAGLALPLRVQSQSFEFFTLAGAENQQGSADGTGSAARFTNIRSLVVDRSGNLIASDFEAHTLRRITPSGVVTTLAGSPGIAGAVEGTGAAARFNGPNGLAVDEAGNILVADTGNYAIRKITQAGAVTTLIKFPERFEVLSFRPPRNYPITPTTIAVDAAGNLIVAFSRDGVVYKVTNGNVTSLAGHSSENGPVDGAGPNARLAIQSDLAVDSSGHFVFGQANAIRKMTATGVVSTIAGAATQPGSADGAGSVARFYGAWGCAIDPSGLLYVADFYNRTIRTVTAEGVATTIAGSVQVSGVVDGIGGSARFNGPSSVAIGPTGRLYVVDDGGRIIRQGVPTTAPSPPIVTTPPAQLEGLNQNIGAGTTLSLSVTASGTPPLTYQWSRNGQPIAGATTAIFSRPSVSIADDGDYTVAVSNRAGTATPNKVAVRVYTPPYSAFTPRRSVPGGSFLWGIARSSDQLVAVGTGGSILTSSNGRTWTQRDSGTTAWLVGVTYSPEARKFVAVGEQGTILTSTDGVSWTRAANSGTTQRLNNVAYGFGTFIAVGEAGTVLFSNDAQRWTTVLTSATGWLRGISRFGMTYSHPREAFLLSGQGGKLRLVTPAGVETGPTPDFGSDIENLNGPFGVGQDGSVIYGSYIIYSGKMGVAGDGVNWYRSNVGINARFRGVASGAGAVFAMGENGVIAAAASPAGPWAIVPSSTTANLVNGVFFGDSLFVIGENETILQSEPFYSSRLVNIATRGNVGSGANTMISGFVIDGTAPKQVLVRAAGPALGNFGLQGTLARPALALFDSTGHQLAANTGWGTAVNSAAIAEAAARAGAFPFAAGSTDAAMLVTLPPGNYSAHVTGSAGASGLGLTEIYDADPISNEGSRAINISTRGNVGLDGDKLIAGFVINGAASRRILIRAVGPSLAQFGLNGVLTEPRIELFNNRGSIHDVAGAWPAKWNAEEIRSAAISVGAFPLGEDSKDAALVTTLLPGSWTVQVSGRNNSTGLALVEVYEVP